MQTRSNFTGDLSFACSIRNLGRWLRTAVCSSTGMFTRPNEIEPFQSALAMSSSLLQFALRFEPVLEIHAVAAAALQIPLIGPQPDVFLTGLRAQRRRTPVIRVL